MQAKLKFRAPNWWMIVGAIAICLALLAIPVGRSVAQSDDGDDGDGGQSASTPDDCATCHSGEYEVWHTSNHASALDDPRYIEGWNRAGNPSYCQSCHATGYDASSGSVTYEGVGCTACHTDAEGKHPESDMTVDKSSELCGTCHSGPHAPDYNQWLAMGHATVGIGCVDCHQSHSTSLHLDGPTELCASCHKMDQDIHGSSGMACIDCHMAPGDTVTDPLSGQTNGAGHTFSIPANVCAKCHGMTHTVAPDGTQLVSSAKMQPPDPDTAQAGIAQSDNLALTAGGIAGLVIGIVVPLLLNRRGGKHESTS